MPWRLAVVVVVLALATVVGLVMQGRSGRFRSAAVPVTDATPAPDPADVPAAVVGAPARASSGRSVTADTLGAPLGSRATLLQFSSAFCAPCRATRTVLADVARIVPGVQHIEIDAESHLDLVRELNVLSTPTVFVLDAAGAVVSRASGLPKRQVVLTALAQAMPPSGPAHA